MSVYFMAIQSTMVGQFVAGALTDLLGGVTTLLLAAAIQGTFVLLALAFAKPVREFRSGPLSFASATNHSMSETAVTN